ncbi:hypothetical protein CTAYLR_003283 [Chrysophaeum taylorii]|uniref:Vps53 N-terminal domain-containing protein n=1 Tax=Chrysophaeum taylorii TaxID=2483200 RepID=A0AAD7UAL9_9STRA|nr:hypothetical protein CTAYLR_003283 [Chrysophaeum taylorii]
MMQNADEKHVGAEVVELGLDVQSAMADVLPSADPLDATDFDAIEYLNSKFATERSLSQLDVFIGDVTSQITKLDDEISKAVHAQAEAGARASRDIGDARQAMTELHQKIGEIKQKADESEGIVREICSDIKSLDCAKRNLVTTITALKRTNMLTTAVAQLRAVGSKQYSEAANLLDAIAGILSYFEPYGDVPRIAEITAEVSEIRKKLEDEVFEAFDQIGKLADKELDPEVEGFASIKEACLVVDALGARERQLAAFCARQIEPYAQLFPKGGQYSSLDDVERRFSWIRRLLRTFQERNMFPEDWQVEARLVDVFVAKTKDMFLEILPYEQNVAVTLKALQKSLVFEKEVRARLDHELELAQVFDPFMQPYVALEKKNMEDMMRKADDEIDQEGALPVFSSSVQLFAYVKTSIKRCTALTCGQTFFKLHKTFCECLMDYAKRLMTLMTSMEATCYCLNTAEYCAETVEQLADIIKSKIQSQYVDQIDLEEQQEAFHDVIAAAVKKLVASLEASLEPSLKAMASIQWSSLQSVDEESAYVRQMGTVLKSQIPNDLSSLYYRNFCDKFVASFLPKFYQTVVSTKRINEIGTHQLLLDIHSLKPLFLELTDNATYTKFVTKHLAKVEMVLKLVGTPTEMLVERFKIMWPDGTRDDLLNVCTLKGLKKADQTHLVDTLYGGSPSPTPPDDDTRFNIESKLESVSQTASLTINKVGSQMRDLIQKSAARPATSRSQPPQE